MTPPSAALERLAGGEGSGDSSLLYSGDLRLRGVVRRPS